MMSWYFSREMEPTRGVPQRRVPGHPGGAGGGDGRAQDTDLRRHQRVRHEGAFLQAHHAVHTVLR